jgi:DNA-binding NtrC family response regulator
MKEKFTILVADRNSHVRGLIKRELMEEGYRIRLAENGREVLKWAFHPDPLDLVILDPDLPDVDEACLFKKLNDRIPMLPIIIHSFRADFTRSSFDHNHAVFVEKQGNSIENLKKIVHDFLFISSSKSNSGSDRRPNRAIESLRDHE